MTEPDAGLIAAAVPGFSLGNIMEYINTEEFCLKHTCVTLGKFDGIHLGHRLLLQQLAEEKKRSGAKSVVFTFDFHPGMFFSRNGGQLIYTPEEKMEILKEAGADILIAYPFTRETSGMEAEDFIEQVLVKKLGAEMIAVGKDNRFGHNRRGNAAMLQAFSKRCGFRAVVCDKLRDGEDIISSTLIRKELGVGNIERANRLLGAPYHISGRIEHGRQLGRKLGFPTINLIPPEDKLLPPRGVYASRTLLPSGIYYGVTNVGVRPTVGTQRNAWVETCLLDYQGECYGEPARTEFCHFMRPEQQFADIDALRQQIARDKKNCAGYFMRTF